MSLTPGPPTSESLAHNHWQEGRGFTLWNYGLGATPGTFNLTLGLNPGGSSFHMDRVAPKYRRPLPVRVATLDSLAVQEGWLNRNVSLVKVDVEGFENFVFEGGLTFFNQGKVDWILMENSITNITVVGRMFDILFAAGYRIREILSVNGDPYHQDWWHTFNPALAQRHHIRGDIISDQLKFLAKGNCNVLWRHLRLGPGMEEESGRAESLTRSVI